MFYMIAVACGLAACGGGGSGGTVSAGLSASGGLMQPAAPSPTQPASTIAMDANSSPKATARTLESSTNTAVARIVVVGTGSSLVPLGATVVVQLTDVPWSTLGPGSLVFVRPGTYAGPVMINATGSAAAPIRIQAADPSQIPVINNSVDMQGSSYVIVSGLLIQSPIWGGFVVRNGSHHVTLSSNVVRAAPIGINIMNGIGAGIVISNNLIEDSATHGIGVAANGSPAEMNVIMGNTVRRSGQHGMEIRGSFWRIERNDTSQSGLAMAGTSGIHIYSGAANEDSGDNNIIRYNVSYLNADTGASDGNGIQVDHWCDQNTIAFNLAWGNDGAGINVFEAAGNKVYSNTVGGNARDPAGTHGALGEIIVGAAADNNRAANNQVFDNIAISTRSNAPAIYVDGRSYGNNNTVGPNLIFNTAGGSVMRWSDSLLLLTGASVDTATGTRGNLTELPAFAAPYSGTAAGLKLTRAPTTNGTTLTNESDFAGIVAQAGYSFFGAYFTSR